MSFLLIIEHRSTLLPITATKKSVSYLPKLIGVNFAGILTVLD